MKKLSEEELNNRADFLNSQVNYNGWGNLHRESIFGELKAGKDKFFIAANERIRELPVVGLLNFEVSNVKATNYMQYKGFDLTAPGPDKEIFTQNFKYSPYQAVNNENGSKLRVNSPLSKTEAFNVMGGGAVLGTFTKKDPLNGNITIYKAYSALNFNYQDEHGNVLSQKDLQPSQINDGIFQLIKQDNVQMIKLPDFGLEYKLTQLPILNLNEGSNKQNLIEKMNKGHIVTVLLNIGGKTTSRSLQADPFNRTIAQYNEKMERIDIGRRVGKDQSLNKNNPDLSTENSKETKKQEKDNKVSSNKVVEPKKRKNEQPSTTLKKSSTGKNKRQGL